MAAQVQPAELSSEPRPVDIFFADDHELVRATIAGYLSDNIGSATVYDAGTFEDLEALLSDHLAVQRSGHQAIILMDLQMPGVVLPKSIYALVQRYPDVPVVILSGNFNKETALSILSIGAKALVPKSSAPSLLIHVINLVRDGQTYFPAELITQGVAGGHQTLPNLRQLTPRENEVAELISSGLTNKEVARALGITDGTVKVATKSIFRKTGVTNRTQLARLVIEAQES